MQGNDYYIFCVEHLSIGAWFFKILPYILNKKFISNEVDVNNKKSTLLIYYLKASRLGLLLASLNVRKKNIVLRYLDFDLAKIKDVRGDLVWWKSLYEDSMVIQQYIKRNSEFKRIIKVSGEQNKTSDFLLRYNMYADYMNKNKLILPDIFLVIRVLLSSSFFSKECQGITLFFSSQKIWLDEVIKCVNNSSIEIVPINKIDFNLKRFIMQFDFVIFVIKKILYYKMILFYNIKTGFQKKKHIDKEKMDLKFKGPKMAVEYYGHLNLDSPELNSDLFFFQQSKFISQDILVYFQQPLFPISDKDYSEIKKFGMDAVALDSGSVVTPNVSVFWKYFPRKFQNEYSAKKLDFLSAPVGNKDDVLMRHHLYRQLKDYYRNYDYWINFIKAYNIKMHVSWYKHDAKEFALWDAIKDAGGIGVIYQRSFEGAPDPWTITSTDLVFGFSKLGADFGYDEKSTIPYYVITGYLGDHRFSLVRKQADNVRKTLQVKGVTKILTYFDESSVDDQRWNLGHKNTQENYDYLLDKVLNDKTFGLILKPKMISTLRKRLGNVSSTLEKAIDTGRCFMFDKGHVIGSDSPAAAALAADIVVHGHLFSATAGVESALAGAKTLMLDREGISRSPLYKLGVGRVIFKNWEDLWTASLEYWNNSEKVVSGFGDWSPILDELDPFRDNRAAERMGTYLKWLMEGFKSNLSRETILADAAERYAKIWGKDKILSINYNLKTVENSFEK